MPSLDTTRSFQSLFHPHFQHNVQKFWVQSANPPGAELQNLLMSMKMFFRVSNMKQSSSSPLVLVLILEITLVLVWVLVLVLEITLVLVLVLVPVLVLVLVYK